jgi:hypothetical protein
LKFLLQQDLSFKLAIGRYHQFLTIANSEDESLRIIDFWLGIPAERQAPYADHLILGIEYLSEENWLFRAETYYKHFENLITLKQGELFQEEQDELRFTPFNEFYDTKGYAYGLELLYKKLPGACGAGLVTPTRRQRGTLINTAGTIPNMIVPIP